ncbi:MAG TPA: hypothetical protein VFY75_08140 [Solirubrobacterales bacterium]|nr:hypothetical protein [Solirubrobacterales bacterium]
MTGIGLDLDRLGRVDDLWTAYLDGAATEDLERDRDELDHLAGGLIAAIEIAAESVARLRSMLEATDEEELEFAMQQIFDRYPDVVRDSRERLADLLAEYSFRGAAIDACAFLENQLPDERRDVEKKRKKLAAGELQPGDLGARARCALSGAKLGASALVVVMTGGAAAPIVVSGAIAVMDLAQTWEEGCGALAGGIWSRLSHA